MCWGSALIRCPCGWFQVRPEFNMTRRPSVFPAITFFLGVMCSSKLVCVRGEVWLQTCPLCWVRRGCGSVASTPCCSLCSLPCEEDHWLVFCCWDRLLQMKRWCRFCPFLQIQPTNFGNLLCIFNHSDGRADVTFLLVQQAQLVCGEWHQVAVVLDFLFTARKQNSSNDLSGLLVVCQLASVSLEAST